ncbi:hypothetical protein [Guptibacillus spartinae]|uniref:hypothetical protein n=1 Tax=Guptibacillus spartinae TaxID=3025679 RepID=UPI0023616706|nr:hypothetical protein [Pseudalkalibacillus spartinae]
MEKVEELENRPEDEEEQVLLEKRIEGKRKEWNLVKEKAGNFPLSTINFESGTQELKFLQQKKPDNKRNMRFHI